MAHGEDRALSRGQVNYIRGVYTVGVSVRVLWKFVEYQIQECDRESSEWWAAHTATGKGGLQRSSWQYKKITDEAPERWDISVLCAAVLNCEELQFEAGQKEAVCALKDIRNNHLFHKKEAEIEFDEYIDVIKKSLDNYKKLLKGDDGRMFIIELESISERRLRDEETEEWIKELRSRDKVIKFQEEWTEEGRVNIHASIQSLARQEWLHLHEVLHKQQRPLDVTAAANVNVVIHHQPPVVNTQAIGAVKVIVPTRDTENMSLRKMEHVQGGATVPFTFARDPVNQLQEYCHQNKINLPFYEDEECGFERFKYCVTVNDMKFEGSVERSKKDAKKAAALVAMSKLNIVQ